MKKPQALALVLFSFSFLGLGLLSPYLDSEDETPAPRFEPSKEQKEEGESAPSEEVETIMIQQRAEGPRG